MPIYEYRRPDGTTFEIQQSFSDEALTVDPETGVPVERVLHPPAVHFKGKGFYNTDYGTRKRQRETAASEKSSSDGSASTGDSSKSSGSDAKSGSPGTDSGKGSGKDSGKDSSKGSGTAKDSKAVASG
jgi:predicted nucleic acid-binding Zn ribbon protein